MQTLPETTQGDCVPLRIFASYKQSLHIPVI